MQAFSDVRAIPLKQGKCIACEFIPSGLVDNLIITIKVRILYIAIRTFLFVLDYCLFDDRYKYLYKILTTPYEYEDIISHKYSTYNFGQAQRYRFPRDRYWVNFFAQPWELLRWYCFVAYLQQPSICSSRMA